VPEPRIEHPADFRERVAARAVGTVMHNTPARAEVPCQRVVNRWGRLAPTYGWGGFEEHKRELEAEGVEVRPDYTVDLQVYQWWPDLSADPTLGDLPAG
jgi:alkylated DNA nucleotide flippase Atl1